MKFSVIIPLYNKAPYVRKALESVFAQTYTDFEIIVVDDGSADESASIVETMLCEVMRLQGYKATRLEDGKAEDALHNRLIAQSPYRLLKQKNAGVSAARNYGFSVSSGDYIAFLDADDWWEPTNLERMAQLIADYPEAGLYASNYMYYKPGKTRVAVNNIETGYFNYPKAYYEGSAMPVTSISVVIPRKVLDETGGFPLGIKLGEDFLLWAKIAMQYKVAFLNEPLAWYNNDVPATLRATRNLHHPKYHMLFNLVLLGEEAIRRIDENNSKAETSACTPYTACMGDTQQLCCDTPSKADWKSLLDKLRSTGLLEYWLDKRYHDLAAEELKKVDWSKQPESVIKIYKTPIWILKAKRLIMRWGSFVKQVIIKVMR